MPGHNTASIHGPITSAVLRVLATLALGMAVLVAVGSADAAGGRTFTATLSGLNEVNSSGVPNQGDPDGSGIAEITLRKGRGEICYRIEVSNITLPATAAHIHFAPESVVGPVVVTLAAPDSTGVSGACVSVDPMLMSAIGKNPSSYYVNVHNVDYPAGAVRGQLSK